MRAHEASRTVGRTRSGARSVYRRRRYRRRRMSLAAQLVVLVLAIAFLPAVRPAMTPHAQAAASCPAGGCSVTVDGRDFASDTPLAHFNYIVNVDNTKLPSENLALNSESNSPIVREGDESRKTVNLPRGRYLISVRALDHKMWGAHITLPDDAEASGNLTVHIALTTQTGEHPLPLGKIRVFVFNDNTWTNGAP